ncbi:hypothetical protein H0H81_001148 [Sphagnurus paluster]|uniref:Uncharacterized protein n=1 Tax=Sphagnurus paluster TaxID=117069 RepID=A0A9P7GX74_9AGAR|nr:hypothetical protein H0H81_001148 [Sphagnurus paluster]
MSPLHDPSSPAYKKANRLFKKATKHRDPLLELEWTPFRAAEKKFKARFPPPDLSDVLDLATLDPGREQEIQQGVWHGSTTVQYTRLSKNAYAVPHIPGLVILPSFIAPEMQRDLIRWSLSEQARHPNETNLDIHYHLPQNGIWNTWLSSRKDPIDITIEPKATQEFQANHEPPGPRKLINNIPATPDTFTSISTTPKPPQAPSATVKPAFPSELIHKLRWANIGWYYHWGTKQYDFTKGKGAIDQRLRNLCRDAVATVDWKQVYIDIHANWGEDEPGWMSWNETYGKYFVGHQHTNSHFF